MWSDIICGRILRENHLGISLFISLKNCRRKSYLHLDRLWHQYWLYHHPANENVYNWFSIFRQTKTWQYGKQFKNLNRKDLKWTRIWDSMANAFIHWCADTFWKSTISKRRRICSIINNHLVNCLVNFISCYAWLPTE